MLCHISNMGRLVYSSMLWTLELSQRIKRILKWKTSYFTHPATHYPVLQTLMPLSAAKSMISLPAESISKEAEITLKEWAEHHRPVRQRTVRSETTKDKAGALPLAVYERKNLEHEASFLFQIFNRFSF